MAGTTRYLQIAKLTEEQQKQIAEDLQTDFGIQVERFDERTGEPVLGYQDVQTLTKTFCEEITSDLVEITYRDDKEARCSATITMDKRQFTRTGFCLIGEAIGDGEQVTTSQQAVAIASARAYSAVLRAINFSPIRAYIQFKQGDTVSRPAPELSGDETSQRKRLHALATELGLITPNGDKAYRETLLNFYGVNTSINLNAEQLQNINGFLQAEVSRKSREQRAAA